MVEHLSGHVRMCRLECSYRMSPTDVHTEIPALFGPLILLFLHSQAPQLPQCHLSIQPNLYCVYFLYNIFRSNTLACLALSAACCFGLGHVLLACCQSVTKRTPRRWF